MNRNFRVFALAVLATLSAPAAWAVPGLTLSGHSAAVARTAAAQWSLGLVVDGRRSDAEGITVLAVTPGGAAERLGVREGDRLVAVNGESLAGVPAPGAVFERTVAARGGQVELEVLRDGQRLALAGRANESVAAGSGQAGQLACGYVSAQDPTPRVSGNIYRAEITQINGDSTPLDPQNRYRVQAGRHVLVVREHIDRHHIPRADVQRIRRVQRREGARAYKVVVVNVEPGMRYSIGAELLPERMSPDEIRDHAWWRPVVWQARPEACR